MNRSFTRWAALASAAAILVCTSIVASAQASVTLTDPSGSDFTLGGTAGARVLTCVPSGPPPPGAPTGCAVSVSTSPNPLTSAGGTATPSVTCDPPPAGSAITYSWTKNGASFACTTSQCSPDNLPANTTASNQTYSYKPTACIGTACTTVTPGAGATVPGSGGGGGGGGGVAAAAISCVGFDKTELSRDLVGNELPSQVHPGRRRSRGNGRAGRALQDRKPVRPGKQGMITLAEWGCRRRRDTPRCQPRRATGAGIQPPLLRRRADQHGPDVLLGRWHCAAAVIRR